MKVTISGNQNDLITWLRRVIRFTPNRIKETNRSFSTIILTTLRRNASGRPGPQVQSGEFRSAFRVYTEDDDSRIVAENNSPQTARLEFGFVGRDAEGRFYAQPPYPTFRPTFEELTPAYARELGRAVQEVLES